MHENHLIQRAKLGRCLERGYTLPPGATFGHKNVTCDGGTAAALKFSPLNARIKSASPESLEKDFVRMNRAALKAGVISQTGQKQFRALNDFRLSPPSRDVKQRTTIPENMTFGKPVGKSLPKLNLIRKIIDDSVKFWINTINSHARNPQFTKLSSINSRKTGLLSEKIKISGSHR